MRCGDLAHERHVVLDHEQGVLALERVDDLRGLERFCLRHAGGRLVEQKHLRVLHHQHAELEPLGLAVAEIGGDGSGFLGQPDKLQHLVDALFALAREAEPQIGQHARIAAATRHFEIAAHRQILEDARNLEFAADTRAAQFHVLPCW